MVWSTRLVITIAVVLLCVTCAVWSKPHIPLDAVDTCIFTCDYCYKGDLLLRCANECLEIEGKVPKLWRTTCPYFGKPLYFEK